MDFIFQDNYANLTSQLKQIIQKEQRDFSLLRQEIKPLLGNERRLHRRTANALAMVASDGGNSQMVFDPFIISVVQIVDSQRNLHYPPEIITAYVGFDELWKRHFDNNIKPKSCLGKLMYDLGVFSLEELSYSFNEQKRREKPLAWIRDYRELIEWACLYEILSTKDFSTDTILLFDGLLRSFAFRETLFNKFAQLIANHLKRIYRERKRKVYLAGLAKRSKFLDRYRLAMFLEGVMRVNYPACIEIPPEIERKVYRNLQYTLAEQGETQETTIHHSMGRMFLVKFGSYEADPIWPVDIFFAHVDEGYKIIEALLNDALDGFPIPLYPLSLQKAHEYASIVDLDYRILQDIIMKEITASLGAPEDVVEKFCMQDLRVADRRYPEGKF